jgi:cobalt-zinc-cadmium resistance protein CzcA
MYIFGIDANLMSLGAIDFGIIIDGSVIIVENIAFQISKQKSKLAGLPAGEAREARDLITFKGASKMMNSAIFGQLIILIVFIPILSLSGVEGKMFRPMALTFSFALIGAMILCFTYVPVASTLFLKEGSGGKRNISIRLMAALNRVYEPSIRWSLGHKKWIIGPALLLLASTFYLFSTMGAEFVPTLDEGDFVIQPILKTGTSLGKTIETMTSVEKILLERFPEVDQVVTRIGAAEVPTDPMSMEECDVIITLKPKNTWVSADSKDGLADKFKEALAVIPGMEVEFTQPIEMRFNELITGVRADIAVKVFGEDLKVLNRLGNDIKKLISDVDGAADITVEKIAGLPQMNVKFDRAMIARYGLNIDDLNRVITMGFSGATLGSVFEGEKRFDLALRLDKNSRSGIQDLENLFVDTPMGGKVPLAQLADISVTEGAAKISRDDTKRRIVVGINVRNRDLQSVVDDVRQRIEGGLQLPVGYSITYGGQFENLQSAKSRLLVAVPIALVLIFIMLFFAFNSIRQALMVYSAIPLSAIGGVLLLWIRDMPFSISAGIGFIALFGIAVLNGIVLIEHFRELKEEGMNNIDERIVHGTKDRLRAVLLTASAAALGFLPMAISTSAGAEVQRPLATVVIGGLVTATLLTLVVLPVLYAAFGDPEAGKKQVFPRRLKRPFLLLALLFSGPGIMAQQQPLGLDDLMALAVENNSGLRAASLHIDQSDALRGDAFDFDKTEVYYHFDQNNLGANNEPLDVFGVQQRFLFPTRYFARKNVLKTGASIARDTYELQKRRLMGALSSVYHTLQFAREKQRVYKDLDSLYLQFSQAAQRRFELGETNYLERITAQAKYKEWQVKNQQATEEVRLALEELHALVQSETGFEVATPPMERLFLPEIDRTSHPGLVYYSHREELLKAESGNESQRLLPDISINYFQGSNAGLDENLHGYQLGLNIPLFFQGNASRMKAARIAREIGSEERKNYEKQLSMEYERLTIRLRKYEGALSYYTQDGKRLSDEIQKTASIGYKAGELTFFEYIQSLENANEMALMYLESLHEYNQTIIALTYLTL